VSSARHGYLLGLSAYLLWGLFPAYFKLLRPATPLEILAHRVAWSLVVITLVITALRGWRRLAGRVRRPAVLLKASLAGILMGANWATYIYGVNSDHVVETSLGYFITPLVSMVLGILVFRERLRPTQWAAGGAGLAAVIVLTVDYGRPPWIALILAGTFGSYGMIKKQLAMPAADGLFVESAVLAGPALAYLFVLGQQGTSTFGPLLHSALLMSTGLVTVVPLLCFAGAANRLPLSTLGLLQYVAPVIQFGFGVLLFHEPMPPARLVGFALVWLALMVFTWDGLRSAQRQRRARPVDGAPEGQTGSADRP